MEFNPNNPIVKLCLQGMQLEDSGRPEEAAPVFFQAWNEATDDSGKFLAAYYLARRQTNASDRLKWYDTALNLALAINDDSVKSALPALYEHIAGCCDALGDAERAQQNRQQAAAYQYAPSDGGPFFHGTRADLHNGDQLTPGWVSNYDAAVIMNHIYFTALPNGAGLAAALAKGEGRERVYIVEPTGAFENDPNVTDKKFPGNPTRSYRTAHPLTIVGELTDWDRPAPEVIEQFRSRLDAMKGKIIN